MSVLVSTFVQRFEPNRTHSYFYTRRLNRPDRDKFLFALPARQKYLNSDGLENVKNVVKIVNRPLDVRSPNFSPNVSSPSSFSSATNTFHFHFVIQNFPFSIITTAFSFYSNKLYASSFPFANKLINITRNSTFSFYRTHDLYILYFFRNKTLSRIPPPIFTPPLYSILAQQQDRTSGKSRGSMLKLTETRVCAAIKARRAEG